MALSSERSEATTTKKQATAERKAGKEIEMKSKTFNYR